MGRLIGISALMIALSIAAGAFGAHSLKDRLDSYYLSVYEKAALYHLTQSLGLLAVAILGAINILPAASVLKIFVLLLFGVIVFSGSLYLLTFTQIKWLGAITPIGGTAMIAAWLWLAIAAFRS